MNRIERDNLVEQYIYKYENHPHKRIITNDTDICYEMQMVLKRLYREFNSIEICTELDKEIILNSFEKIVFKILDLSIFKIQDISSSEITRQDIYKVMSSIMTKKSNDYANNIDVLSNFKMTESLFNIPSNIGVLIRMSDKVSRINELSFKDQMVEDESILDTLIDLCNYGILFLLILQDYIEQSLYLKKALRDLNSGE